jgi:peptidoglycan-associated lipoprotein
MKGQERKMQLRSWRNSFALVIAGFVLAGCAGRAAMEEPPEPLPPDQRAEVTRTLADPNIRRHVDSDGNPLNPGTGEPLTRVFYFDFDRAVLRPDSLAALEQHAAHLRENPDRRAVIEGHTDERGSREYNMALGERRADAVRTFLVSNGVRRAQLDIVSYGEERPVNAASTESAFALNRRAELIYR